MRFYFIIFCTITLCSCSNLYVQMYETKGVNLIEKPEGWTFENDSIKVTYNFNGYRGNMSFTLFNKLNKPIYIDWKNSSFIYKSEKFNYWIDETNTNGSSVQSNVLGKNILNPYDRNIYGASVGLIKLKSVKAERITFIPPQSGISSETSYYQFKLIKSNVEYNVDPKKAKKISTPNLYRKNKTLKGYEYLYDEDNTIISFRNYIAITSTENSNQFTFLDNKFYVSSLKELDSRAVDKNIKSKKTNFYIDDIIGYNSAKSRDK